ncbi:hypothetical protein [Methylobacterium sp. JK268]
MRKTLILTAAALAAAASLSRAASARDCRWYGGPSNRLYACQDTSGYGERMKQINAANHRPGPMLTPIYTQGFGKR